MFKIVVSMLLGLVCATAIHAESLRDPMRPWDREASVVAAAPGVPLSLSAILFSDERRVAIVNGRTVSEGDLVAGVRVHRIFRNSLLIDNDGLLSRLSLPRTASIRHRSKQ